MYYNNNNVNNDNNDYHTLIPGLWEPFFISVSAKRDLPVFSFHHCLSWTKIKFNLSFALPFYCFILFFFFLSSPLDYCILNSLSTNSTKWSNILKQIVGCCRQIVWVYLTFRGVGAWRFNLHVCIAVLLLEIIPKTIWNCIIAVFDHLSEKHVRHATYINAMVTCLEY